MTPQNPLTSQPQQGQQLDPRKDLTQPIGPNFENLSTELRLELWNLLMEQERQDEIPRRFEIKDILKRRLFFRGEQYWWWSDTKYCWNPPTAAPDNMDDFDVPPFQYVTNIIQPFLLTLQAVLSQDNTQAKFWPEKPSNPDDVQMAQAASKVVDFVHRNNDWQNLIDDATYFMGTDGFLGGYVSYVSDSERFGTDDMLVLGLVDQPVGDPMVACPGCGNAAMGSSEQMPVCPDCGEAMQDAPQQTAQVATPIGQISIPKGQEVIRIIGALQLKRDMWADDQKDFLYLTWITDVHKAKAMATYPHAAKEIEATGGSAIGGSGTSDTYERIARRLLYMGTGRHTGMVLEDLGVMRRSWIRPALFELVKNDPIKAMLKQLYPDGAHVVFFNDVYCESCSESMDEKWETMHAMPGEGQLRETLISAIMPVQDQLNDATNLIFEQGMNGVPEGSGIKRPSTSRRVTLSRGSGQFYAC